MRSHIRVDSAYQRVSLTIGVSIKDPALHSSIDLSIRLHLPHSIFIIVGLKCLSKFSRPLNLLL